MENKTRIVVTVLVAIAVFLALLFLVRGIASIVNKNSNQPQKTASKVVVPTKLTVAAGSIVKDPLVYNDLKVEVNTSISDWVTKRVFAVNAAGSTSLLFGGATGQLIVIAPKDFPLNTSSNQTGLGLGQTGNVHLKGKVRIVDKAEFEKLSGINLEGPDIKLDDNRVVSNWERGPVLILDSVEKL